jgi:hypothetical protein
MGGVTPFIGLLKTTSTIAFQQVTPPSSTHRRTPDSVIAHFFYSLVGRRSYARDQWTKQALEGSGIGPL